MAGRSGLVGGQCTAKLLLGNASGGIHTGVRSEEGRAAFMPPASLGVAPPRAAERHLYDVRDRADARGLRFGKATPRPFTATSRESGVMFNDNGSFLLALLEFFLFFAWLMLLFWVFSDIFRSHDIGGVAKTIWVIVVIVLPWLGVLLYLIIRGGGMSKRAMEQQKEMQAAQAEYIKSVAGTDNSAADQIASAKKLLDAGTITQAEFDSLKAKALS